MMHIAVKLRRHGPTQSQNIPIAFGSVHDLFLKKARIFDKLKTAKKKSENSWNPVCIAPECESSDDRRYFDEWSS